MTLAIVIAECLLLAAGLILGRPFLGAATAAGVLFLVLAYRRPGLAWMLVWLACPFSIETLLPGGHAMYLPSEAMITLALLAWMIRAARERSIRIPRSRLDLSLATLAAVSLLSVMVSHHLELGVKALMVATGYVLFAFVYCLMTQGDAARSERWAPWVVGAGAFWGAYGTIRVGLEGVTLRTAYGAGRPFFTEHGAYAAYLAMILPLALLLALERRGRARWLYAASALLMALGIVLSLTRAAWVSLAIVIPLMAALWSWSQRSLKAIAYAGSLAAIVIVIIVGFGVGGEVGEHAGSITETGDVSNVERFNRWMAAIEMVRARPLLGVGFDCYAFAYPQYRRKVLITDLAYQHMGAHSEPMRLLAETGVTGFAAACWFVGAVLVLGLRVVLRSPEPQAKLLSLAILAGLGTYAIHAVFRTYFDLEKVVVPFWASIGVLAALGRRLDAPSPSLQAAGSLTS